MTEARHLETDNGSNIPLYEWMTDDGPIVQLLHGLGEHAARYERFAAALNAAGYGVVAHDHRGHGRHEGLHGHFAEGNGWQCLIDDAAQVLDDTRQRWPGRPVILFGHSMGSFVAQCVAMDRSNDYAAMVLSGSTWTGRLALLPGLLLAKLVSAAGSNREPSALLDRLGFARLNKPFQPARSDYDWLSTDEAEVDRYVADPLCGGPFTRGLWVDFLGGMMRCGSDNAISRIRSDLPILILGGADDPVGGDKGLGKLMTHYAQTGHSRLKIRLYDGARHEMLNETNRDEVTGDILAWLDELPIRR